jgi:hypothetical protein
MDPDTLFGAAALLAMGFILAGSWTVHRRARSRASACLLWTTASFIAWFPISSLVQYAVLAQGDASPPTATLNWIFVSSEIFVPALLLVAAAASFWLATRAIAPRPADSPE